MDRLTLSMIIFVQDIFISREKKRLLLSVFLIPKSENELEKEILNNLERDILKDLEREFLNLSFSEAEWLLTGGEGGCAGTLRPAKRRR